MPTRRQTSPLNFEPFSPNPTEIIWDEDESEEDADTRAAKRRRIEKLGQDYLEGKPLFILTATLRGPFDNGWVNPWKRKRVRLDANGAVKRTKKKRPLEVLPVPETVERRPPEKIDQHDGRQEVQIGFGREVSTNSTTANRYDSRRQRSNRPRQVDWLKTDGGHPNEDGRPKSPTPTPIARLHRGCHLPSPGAPSGFTPMNLAPKQNGENVIGARGRMKPAPTLPIQQPDTTRDAPASSAACASPAKERTSLHAIPPSTYLPGFEYRPAGKRPKTMESVSTSKGMTSSPPRNTEYKQKVPRRMEFSSSTTPRDKPEAAIPQQQHNHNISFQAQPDLVEDGDPQRPPNENPSTETTTNITSAQVQPENTTIANPVPSLPSTELEPEKQIADDTNPEEDSILYLSTQDAVAKAQRKFQADLISPTKHSSPTTNRKIDTAPGDPSVQSPASNGITPFSAFNSPSVAAPSNNGEPLGTVNAIDQLSTQAMIDAVTPFAFSTAKKVTKPSKSTSPTAKRKNKIKKRASFAPTSPHEEPPTTLNDNPNEPSPFGKLGLDMETSPETEDVSSPSHQQPSMPAALSNELPPPAPPLASSYAKSNLPHNQSITAPLSASSTTAPFPFTGPTSAMTGPDGQGAANLIENFDDVAAMEEAGSFLQSWDVEKELRRESGGGMAGSCSAYKGSVRESGEKSGKVWKSR